MDIRFHKAFFNRAKAKLALGQFKKARVLLKQAIAIQPRETSYYLALATLHTRAKDLNEAVTVYEQGRKLASNDGQRPGHDGLGLVYYHRKQYETAILLLKQAAKTMPDSVIFHYHLGASYAATGKTRKAKGALERALSVVENAPWATKARHLLSTL